MTKKKPGPEHVFDGRIDKVSGKMAFVTLSGKEGRFCAQIEAKKLSKKARAGDGFRVFLVRKRGWMRLKYEPIPFPKCTKAEWEKIMRESKAICLSDEAIREASGRNVKETDARCPEGT